MTRILPLLLLTPVIAQAAGKVYTGFNYGAFWGDSNKAKVKSDFIDGFNLAKKLGTDIVFDSARLFTCRQQGSDSPTEAFDAAVETNTNLLLGFWITPAKKDMPPDDLVTAEIGALEKGFQKHGQALADLVIGLSIGNEDIYREKSNSQVGLTAEVIMSTVEKIKTAIATSSFADYMKDKPIGHVDTADHAVIDKTDFIGMTAYPYWTGETIFQAKQSFHGSLDNVVKNAGDRPVWIAEMGWPFNGTTIKNAIPGAAAYQQYWTDVGCSVFGKYNTFWFNLLNDATADQPDWGLLDSITKKPRIQNLSCEQPKQPPPASSPSAPPPVQSPTSSKAPDTPPSSGPEQATSFPAAGPPAKSKCTVHVSVTSSTTVQPPTKSKSTVHVTTTTYKTVQPSLSVPPLGDDEVIVTVTTTKTIYGSSASAAPSSKPTSGSPVGKSSVITSKKKDISNAPTPQQSSAPAFVSIPPLSVPWCVTVADIDNNGTPVTIAGDSAGPNGECPTPPPYNGYPYIITAASQTPTPVPAHVPWCVTTSDIDHNGHGLVINAGPTGENGKCGSDAITVSRGPAKTTQTAAPAAPAAPPPASLKAPLPVAPTSAPALAPSAGSNPVPAPTSVAPATPTPAPSSPAPAASAKSSEHPYCKAKRERRALAKKCDPCTASKAPLSS